MLEDLARRMILSDVSKWKSSNIETREIGTGEDLKFPDIECDGF